MAIELWLKSLIARVACGGASSGLGNAPRASEVSEAPNRTERWDKVPTALQEHSVAYFGISIIFLLQ